MKPFLSFLLAFGAFAAQAQYQFTGEFIGSAVPSGTVCIERYLIRAVVTDSQVWPYQTIDVEMVSFAGVPIDHFNGTFEDNGRFEIVSDSGNPLSERYDSQAPHYTLRGKLTAKGRLAASMSGHGCRYTVSGVRRYLNPPQRLAPMEIPIRRSRIP